MGKSEGSGKSDDKKESGGKSLNEQNWPGLLAITAFNLVVFAVVIATEPKWLSDLATAWAFMLPAGVGLAMIRVVNGLITAKNKNRLVSWNWAHPLPASYFLSVHAKNDDRFSEIKVTNKLRELGLNPEALKDDHAEQNRYWYGKIFMPLQE